MIEWIHKPGSTVPYRSKDGRWSVGVNFHAMYQAIKSGPGRAGPVGPMCSTPEEARAHAEQEQAGQGAE